MVRVKNQHVVVFRPKIALEISVLQLACVSYTSPIMKKRIELIDALRGFAIAAIILLHNMEHFDFVYKPEGLPTFVQALDKHIWAIAKFMFAGKAYAIFALLFGFSFYLMDQKQQDKGVDFRGRFLWRMLILLGFGLINGALYQGDILTMYAVLGVTLAVVCRWQSKWVLLVSVILLLQPVEFFRLIYLTMHPETVPMARSASHHYFQLSHVYLEGSSFWETIKGNFTNGRWGVIVWSWEKGRFLQTPALFMIGFLLGKHQRFDVNAQLKFWKSVFVWTLLVAVPLYWLKDNLDVLTTSKLLKPSVKTIVNSYYNFVFMMLLVASFVLLYRWARFRQVTDALRILGRMSLTNYVSQSLVGAVIYYGFGFGLYFYTGASYCLAIGLIMLFLQVRFCKWWLASHAQGPLEYFWHKATWYKFAK